MIKVKRTIKLILYITLILSSFQCPAQNFKWEIWQNNIPVSGGVRVGLMCELKANNNNNNHIKKPNEFYIWSFEYSEIDTDSIEIEISSKDGRYSAKFKGGDSRALKGEILPISVKSGFIYRVTTNTHFRPQLKEFNRDALVILASVVDKDKKNKYLVSSWDKNIEPKDSNEIGNLGVYINSQIPTKLTYGEKNKRIEVECMELVDPAIAFNKKCEIPNINLKEKDRIIKNLTIVQRIRRLGQTKLISYEFPLK